MKSIQTISYTLAYQKAYRDQIKCSPQVMFVKDNGMWGTMPYKVWMMIKPGTPKYYVSHTDRGINVALWEFKDNGRD